MTNSVITIAEERQIPDVRVSAMLELLGIEGKLQLVLTVSILALIIVTTLGGSGGAAWVFITYRTLLIVIAILSAVGSSRADWRISSKFLLLTILSFSLLLISVLRVQGSHFEGFYLWYKYILFASALLNLAHYARYQSARWKGVLLASVVLLNLAHLVPELVRRPAQVVAFSPTNPNYFATFLLIGFAVSAAAAVFAMRWPWRVITAAAGAVILFGIIKTASRGATLAALIMIVVAAVRAGNRIPRQVWLGIAALGLAAAVIFSPYLIRKFVDRGETDPYNYARTQIWRTSFEVIAQRPVLGVGFGQFFNVSKRFALPIEGTVARYGKRAQMAHNEYLQHMAELGIPSAVLLFGLLGYLLYLAWARAKAAWPEYRLFHEAALFTATAVGVHALVDNCWTIPVTASSIVVLSTADLLPLQKREISRRWTTAQIGYAGLAMAAFYVVSIVIPGIGLYYKDLGHAAFDRGDFVNAERFQLAAIRFVPDHPLFLDNLGMVYLQKFSETRDQSLLSPARKYFARAIAASPQSIDPHMHMETLLLQSLSGNMEQDRGLHHEIIREDTAILQIDPYIPFARKNLATAYYSIGQPEHAFEQLAIALKYEPNFVPAYLAMAAWYREHGDPGASQKSAAIALNIVNKYRDFKPDQAYDAMLLGRPQESWIQLTAPKK